jgi:OmpR family two-component system sensor histidine kinase YxdK
VTWWLFIRDQWRHGVFFFIGILLMLAVFWFAAKQAGLSLPLSTVLYALLLGAVMWFAYILVEFLIRRPFYRDLQHRLSGELSVLDGDIPLTAATAEQRAFSTLLKRYQETYTQRLTELEERQHFFETFCLRFAHQMKTPVTVIRLVEQELRQTLREAGVQHTNVHQTNFHQSCADHASARHASTAQADVDTGAHNADPTLEPLDTLAEECSRLESSIDTMLYTARLKAFAFDARMERIDIIHLLRDVVNQHKGEWIRRKLYPRLDAPSEPVWVMSDRKWLSFMADQVVRNALQYGFKTDSSGNPVPSTFVIRIAEDADRVRIEFCDEGIGIPERDLRRVFDPFFTGANGRTHSRATGMGLYLVREVADKLGHTVSIASELGNGTTVTFILQRPDYYRPAMAK